MARGEVFRAHAFEYPCAQSVTDHRLTKPWRPWTNGQVEHMDQTLRDATARRDYSDTHDQLRGHLGDFLTACDFAPRRKTLRGLTLYGYICRIRTNEPQRCSLNPPHQMPVLNSWSGGRCRSKG